MRSAAAARRLLAGLAALSLVVFAAVADGVAPSPPSAQIQLAGPRQVVFDWSEQACGPTQAADLPARAFRDDRGRIQLLLSHFDNFRMVGPALDRLRVDCRPVLRSSHDPDPAHFRDKEWLAAVHTIDGRRVWALVHDEYQGNLHHGRCPQGTYFKCWYNAITLAVSTDRGRTFHRAGHPGRLVATPPYRYRPGVGPTGLFAPTNLVRRDGDGFLYALVRFRDPDGVRGTCLIRSRGISGPWRIWDGGGFGGRFPNPYAGPGRRRACRAISPLEIGEMAETVVFSADLDEYVLVGMAADRSGGDPKAPGVYFSTSADLVRWSPRKLLLPAPTVQTFRCGQRSPIAYPALIDEGSRSRTFMTIGNTAYLYFTELHYQDCRRTPNRDLVRLPVRIHG